MANQKIDLFTSKERFPGVFEARANLAAADAALVGISTILSSHAAGRLRRYSTHVIWLVIFSTQRDSGAHGEKKQAPQRLQQIICVFR